MVHDEPRRMLLGIAASYERWAMQEEAIAKAQTRRMR
jgi:hypothetical protein